jgi:hypothetical protein
MSTINAKKKEIFNQPASSRADGILAYLDYPAPTPWHHLLVLFDN